MDHSTSASISHTSILLEKSGKVFCTKACLVYFNFITRALDISRKSRKLCRRICHMHYNLLYIFLHVGKTGKTALPSVPRQPLSPVHTAPKPFKRGLAWQVISVHTELEFPNLRMNRDGSHRNRRTKTTEKKKIPAFSKRSGVVID